MVQIEMSDGGIIKIELDPKAAPITCANFEKLVSEGFYDGLIFHRVIAGFMIQGGDPTGTGMGGSDENIKGEFAVNGIKNPLSHKRGVISMARNSLSMDSASSQFFICHADCSQDLDGKYAAFGYVVSGWDIVEALSHVETGKDEDGKDTYRNTAKDMCVMFFNTKGTEESFEFESLLYVVHIIEQSIVKE